MIHISKIIVVDDDQTNTKMLSFLFTRIGLEKIVFNNPIDAHRWMIDHADEIRMLITDFNMPHINGNELIEKVENKINCPIILISGNPTDLTLVNFLQSRPNILFIEKPFSLHYLEGIIRNYLNKKIK